MIKAFNENTKSFSFATIDSKMEKQASGIDWEWRQRRYLIFNDDNKGSKSNAYTALSSEKYLHKWLLHNLI